jgi:hypothetical protein
MSESTTAGQAQLTSSRAYHLDWIQRTLTRYSLHALAMKAAALTVTVAMLVVTAAVGNQEWGVQGGFNWALTAGVALLFVLWLCDAHYHQLQRLYGSLFDDVRRGQGESSIDMSVASYRTSARFYTVLWEKPMAYLYVGSIIVLTVPIVSM